MMEGIKHFILRPTFDSINDILRMENSKVCGIDGIPKRNVLKINPGHIDLEFDATYRDIEASAFLDRLPELTLISSQTQYIVPQRSAYFEGNIVMDAEMTQHFDLRFSRLSQTTISYEKSYFWRFLFPVDNNEWFLKIQSFPYTDDFGSHHFFNLIRPCFDGFQMNAYSAARDGNHWMIIESSEAISFVEMDHRVHSLIAALGFVLGKRYGDYCFHVASCQADFSVIEGIEALALQKTEYCPYKILTTNNNIVEKWLLQYDYQRYALDDLKCQNEGNVSWYYNNDATVSMDAIGKISQLCYKSNDMLLATRILIEGSIQTLEYQKPFFYIALETITTSLLSEDKTKLPPTIPKEQYLEVVAPLLIDTLSKIPDLSEDAVRIFSSRIRNNINVAPNANKLEAYFPKFGYTLTAADKQAIDKRNSTFHGHLVSSEQSLRDQQFDILSFSLRLHKLCAILLLKKAGFAGKVLNNEVLFGIKEACDRKEPVFIDI